MRSRISPRTKRLQVLIVLASSANLTSCEPSRSIIEVDLVAGKEFVVTVRNTTEADLIIDDRLLGLSTESPVKVEVANVEGTLIPPCSHLDYVGTGSRFPVPPDQQAVLSVQLTALTATRCLTPNERYLFRASLASGDGGVPSAQWIPFRAASLE